MHPSTITPLIRIAVFYDGNFLSEASNFYKFQHPRGARLSVPGVHEFIRHRAAAFEEENVNKCQIVESHYFRGRFSTASVRAKDGDDRNAGKACPAFEAAHIFDEVLIRAGVVQHYFPMDESGDRPREKGIDVWLALEAYDLAVHKPLDVLALVACDGDYIPLVRKLNSLGTRVMLLAWDFKYEWNGRSKRTRTSEALIREVSYPVMMHDEIDSRANRGDSIIDSLFVPQADR